MTRKELDNIVSSIPPVSAAMIDKAYERLDSLTKPKRSLGRLEEIAARFAAICDTRPVKVNGKRVFVFAGDHLVVEEGVSAYPAEVTLLMLKNFSAGGAAINVLARRAGASVEVIDVGVKTDPGPMPGLLNLNVKRGAANIAKGPAMTVEEALAAIGVGVKRARVAVNEGVNLFATGDMGIGNTTPSAAIFSAFFHFPTAALVGPGTGLDSKGIANKKAVVERAVRTNAGLCKGPLEILAALGGLEIAGICGLCLGAALMRIPVVVDGFISTAGALVAMRMCPAAKSYMFFSHMSAEPGHRHFFSMEDIRPILDLDMRLGEGTGAAIAMQIIDDAVAIYNEMATFEAAGIKPGA